MEEKGVIKIRLSTAILCFIILVLIFGITFMYIYYNKEKTNDFEEKNIANSSDSADTVNTVNSGIDATESLDINSEVVKKLYKYVMKSNDENGLVYKTTKVTNENIDEKIKIFTIFANLTKEEAYDAKENAAGLTTLYYKKETFNNKAKEIFGSDIIIPDNEFSYELNGDTVSYKNGAYVYSHGQYGGDIPFGSATKIINAVKKENEIDIYDEYIYIYDTYEKSLKNGIYSDSEMKIKISDNANSEEIMARTSDLKDKENIDKQVFKNIEKSLDGKIGKYKHTYKKGVDGSYYWYSTEPVE